jgi:hypothetical protein
MMSAVHIVRSVRMDCHKHITIYIYYIQETQTHTLCAVTDQSLAHPCKPFIRHESPRTLSILRKLNTQLTALNHFYYDCYHHRNQHTIAYIVVGSYMLMCYKNSYMLCLISMHCSKTLKLTCGDVAVACPLATCFNSFAGVPRAVEPVSLIAIETSTRSPP